MAQAPRRQQSEEPPDSQEFGPGEGVPPEEPQETPPPAEPERVSVRMGGREFLVEPEFAAAYEAREAEFNRRLSDQSREVGDLRRWRQQMDAQQPKTTGPDYSTLVFERPNEAFAQFGQTLEQRITEGIERKYRAEREDERQWDRFYREHPELEKARPLVQGVMLDMLDNQGWRNSGRGYDEFFPVLARQAAQHLTSYSRAAKENNAPSERLSSNRPVAEGGGGPRRGQEPTREQPSEPVSGADFIEQMQAKRRRRAVAE